MATEHSQGSEVPRRAFLKNIAAAAFVAPVVVSFGLDGIASADPNGGSKPDPKHGRPSSQSLSNMTLPNQCIPNQAAVEEDLGQVIYLAVTALEHREIEFGAANSVAQKALHAWMNLARCNERAACGNLKALVDELQPLSKHSSMLVSALDAARFAQQLVCGAS